MDGAGGTSRREALLLGALGVGALAGLSAAPWSTMHPGALTRPGPLPKGSGPAFTATALTDPDLVVAHPVYNNRPYRPGTGEYPLNTTPGRWWLIGSSTAQFASPHVAALAQRLGATVHLDAKAGETDAQISAAMGLAPARLGFPAGVVPPGGRVWGLAAPLSTRASRSYTGSVEGTSVTGTLSWDREFGVPRFERSDEGPTESVGPEARFFPDTSDEHRADLALFLGGGKNSATIGGVSAAQIVAGWQAQHSWLVPRHPRFLRQGFFNNVGVSPSAASRATVDAVNAWGRATLGRSFLDIAAWLAAPAIWDILGIKPGAADLAAQASNNLAPSLADRGGAHLSDAVAQAWVQEVVGPRILANGWA